MKQKLYVARDVDGGLFLYGAEPIRGTRGKWRVAHASSCIKINSEMYPDLEFTDDPVVVTLTEFTEETGEEN